ncbi:hypothetical protein PENTCL1PPCAC_24830 [Pristionchus entomophagus]|uniref:Uncharacterized protein n=1 Tax=Pristionchus entomophagus TaxID=358040 RepID=A0AAV5U6Z1_9BILA|nr:hypothetical protein PENTCL1PPCAC_24830 [Pristionchus entomophagus]
MERAETTSLLCRMRAPGVPRESGGLILLKKNPLKKVREESKKNFLEDVVAFIYSRLDEAVVPPEKLLHPRVFELRNHIERGRTSARSYRKRRAACNHRKRWISSPLTQDFANAEEPESFDMEISSSKPDKENQTISNMDGAARK